MLAINVDDIKVFTQKLFMENLFDEYFVTNIEISTFNNFFVDARINKAYREKELKEINEYSYWRELKPLCFNLIKGKILPLRFKIVLKLDGDDIENFINLYKLDMFKNKLKECFINIIYENNKLSITNGIYISEFIIDKSAERAWDEYILEILSKEKIKFNM